MSEQWEYYPCAMGDATAFIFYDHGIREGLDALPPLLTKLRLTFKAPNARGLPTDAEFEQLSLVDRTIDAFMAAHGGAHVGRVSVQGARYFHCYVQLGQSELADFLNALAETTGYRLDVVQTPDPERKGYWEDLFPSARDWQVIKDLRVIESLEQHGDNPQTARRVDHWAHFPNQTAAEVFSRWAQSEGYTAQALVAPEGTNQYGVHLFHTARPILTEISHHTIALMEAAAERGGDYDGWETSVERA